jgi:ribosomal protein S18 acetylase RimI-like enzyme
MAVQLRPYTPGDFDKLYALDHKCFPRGIAYSKRMLAYFLRMPQGQCIVAEESAVADSVGQNAGRAGSIVGFLITEEDPPLAHILTLDVAESHRRHGVGTQLLEHRERELAERGVREIVLETSVENVAGVAFWERHGFRTVGTIKNYYLGKIDAYEMRKTILAALSKSSSQPPSKSTSKAPSASASKSRAK